MGDWIKCHKLDITTNASGAATVTTPVVNGHVLAVRYVKPGSGGLDAGTQMVLTGTTTGMPIMTKAAMSATANFAPRMATHAVADASAITYDGTRPVNDQIPISEETITCAITSGGNVTTGTVYIWTT